MIVRVVCPYCSSDAKLVTGREIYPHRPDLFQLSFWQCAPCDAYVGCHRGGTGFGDGSTPLGRLANGELRAAKTKAHDALDPLWVGQGGASRRRAYAWLSKELGLPLDQTHIGMFDVDMCTKVVEVCNAYRRSLHAPAKEV